ncbi:MAG TPA: MFS transporter [Mycobacteriales bacterium]|nr:MFS transporter [Mycobacteriales bacterium]
MSTAEDAPEVSARRATYRQVLAIREFRALYIAQMLSITGDQIARIAVAILVFSRTNSTVLTGLTYALSYLPWILGGPLLSGFADRHPKRTVMIVCDLARAIVVLVMAVPHLPTGAVILLVGVVALGEPPFDSARSSLIPDIVGEGEDYATAATLQNTTIQFAVVVGFAVGGAIVGAIGPHKTLVLDALTFALSAFAVWHFTERRSATLPNPGSLLDEVRRGARIVFLDRELRWLVIVTWLILGVTVSTETAAVPYAAGHGRGATTVGLLIASLPFGTVIGALALRQFCSLRASERLMLPMALLAPAVLAFTAFNPDPAIAAVIWFITGAAAAMTLTANRVFVVAVPRHMRGLAFGLAVTGIAASQGIYSLAAGLIAREVGPASAIADLALPTLAAIVVFSVASASFRPEGRAPIPKEDVANSEDLSMPATAARPAARVWALDVLLVLAAAAAVPALAGRAAFADVDVPAWWLFVVFVVGEVYPLEFKIRRQAFQLVLESVPLVLGLMYLPPLELIAIRVGAVALVHALVHKLELTKWIFNLASTAVATLVACEIFNALAPKVGGPLPSTWPATLAAVVASELTFGLLLMLVLGLVGAQSEFPRTLHVLGINVIVTVVMTFLGLVTAASVGYDVSTIWAISVFVALTIAGAQTYHRLAERAAALDRLYLVARELGPVATDPADLAPALTQLRQVILASTLELVVRTGADHDFATIVKVTETATHDDVRTEEVAIDGSLDGLVAKRHHEHRWLIWIAPTFMARRQGDRLSAIVRTADREIGLLTATHDASNSSSFESSDLRLLEAAADQLAAALEKGHLVESLRRAATLDTLTGLANLESLRSFLDTSLEGSAGGVLILVNIDRFREVNDMLGHDAGDAVLAEVARRLQSSPTQGALFARVGGDQFAIAIPGGAGSEVARLAGMAVKSRVDGSLRLAEVSADIRVSVGISRAPEHGSDAATLLRRAEMAMTMAKSSSSGIGEWEPELERDGSRRLQLLTGLRTALSDGSLRVEYQPKLQLGSGEVTGFEALVRWTHPELGPISPVEFVPIAEATGLISALTSTVLRSALTTCRSWHDAGKPVGIAVNVSARSLDDDVLVGQVAAMLTASGLEPRWLTLEITESSVMEDHSRSLEVLRQLRMLGVRLSIDDFGTGYSSLHQLRGLPVHEVKIDRSFVETVDSDDADRAVVHAVVELCDSLGLITVAEGVEKASQAFALEALGVRQVQGYFHGRPMVEKSAMEWLAPRPTTSLALY